MLRSVADNYFTITDKQGNVVYKSVLEDMLFGDTGGKWTLYKSHVDGSYLSAGYVAHRAYAIVPLYDLKTGKMLDSGEYELKFTYKLAYQNEEVSKSYNINVDTRAPKVTTITQYKYHSVDRVRVYIDDVKLSYGIVGYNRVDIHYDEDEKLYYIDETKQFFDEAIEEICEGLDEKRLYIGAVDFARGKIGCIVHFEDFEDYLKGFQTVQGEDLQVYADYTIGANNKLTFINVNTGAPIKGIGQVTVTTYGETEPGEETIVEPDAQGGDSENPSGMAASSSSKGCSGSIATLSTIICIPSLMGATLLFFRKRKGGK